MGVSSSSARTGAGRRTPTPRGPDTPPAQAGEKRRSAEPCPPEPAPSPARPEPLAGRGGGEAPPGDPLPPGAGHPPGQRYPQREPDQVGQEPGEHQQQRAGQPDDAVGDLAPDRAALVGGDPQCPPG